MANDEIDDLIKEMKDTKKLGGFVLKSTPPERTAAETIDDTSINDFVMRKSSLLIEQGSYVLENLKQRISAGSTPEEIDAYAKLVSAVTSSIDVLNKVNIQNKKHTSAKEIKQMDLDNSKRLLDKYEENGGQKTIGTQNNTFIVATREEVMKAILDKAEKKNAKDITVEVNELAE